MQRIALFQKSHKHCDVRSVLANYVILLSIQLLDFTFEGPDNFVLLQ